MLSRTWEFNYQKHFDHNCLFLFFLWVKLGSLTKKTIAEQVCISKSLLRKERACFIFTQFTIFLNIQIYLVGSVSRASQRLSTSGRGNSCVSWEKRQKRFTFSFLLGIATKIQRVFQEECLREEEGEPAESKVLHLYSLSGEPHEIIEGIKKDKQTNAFICSVHLVKRHLPARSECRLTPDPPLSACDGQCQCRNGERNALWWLLPLCKSGHNRLDPTGGVVQGLDEEVPERFGLQWSCFGWKKEPDVGHEVGEAEKAIGLRVLFPILERNLISNVTVKEFCSRICHHAFLLPIANEPDKQKQRMLPLLDLTPSHSR